jgi:predicted enzyme related to lactoylglutathione lyase
MTKKINLITYKVKDINQSKELFTKMLGVEPYVDSAYYVGFKIGEVEIGLTPGSDDGATVYLDVEDIKQSLEDFVAAGATIVESSKDVGGGLLVASVRDLDGHVIGLRQAA